MNLSHYKTGWGKDLYWAAAAIVVLAIGGFGLMRWYDSAQAAKDQRALDGAAAELVTLNRLLAQPVNGPGDVAALQAASAAAHDKLKVVTGDGGVGPRTYDLMGPLGDFAHRAGIAHSVCTNRPELCGEATRDLIGPKDLASFAAVLTPPLRWAAAD